jgi:hypothetical protein
MSSTIHEGRVFETSEESYESHYLLESFENDISILDIGISNIDLVRYRRHKGRNRCPPVVDGTRQLR